MNTNTYEATNTATETNTNKLAWVPVTSVIAGLVGGIFLLIGGGYFTHLWETLKLVGTIYLGGTLVIGTVINLAKIRLIDWIIMIALVMFLGFFLGGIIGGIWFLIRFFSKINIGGDKVGTATAMSLVVMDNKGLRDGVLAILLFGLGFVIIAPFLMMFW